MEHHVVIICFVLAVYVLRGFVKLIEDCLRWVGLWGSQIKSFIVYWIQKWKTRTSLCEDTSWDHGRFTL